MKLAISKLFPFTINPVECFGLQTLHIPALSMAPSPQQTSPPKTGAWGYGLYQSDIDFEMLDLVAAEAAMMMSDPECLRSSLIPEDFSLRAPVDRVAAVHQLEDGILHRLIRRLNHQNNHGAIVILGVVSMELGVKVNPEDLLAIKMALQRWGTYEVKRDQIVRALEVYSNDGEQWIFDGMRNMETAVVLDVANSPRQGTDRGQIIAEEHDGECQ